MYRNLSALLLFLFGVSVSPAHGQQLEHVLWYEQPAENWNGALPLGNGRLGAMLFGKTDEEHIQLNDDSLWPEKSNWSNPAGDKNDLETIRQLLFEGKNSVADSLFVARFSRKKVVRSHQTLGDLFIGYNHENITDYRRELDINTAIAKVTYKSNGQPFTETVFVSGPHRAIVVHIETRNPKGINAKLYLSRPTDQGVATAITRSTNDFLLLMQGEVTQRSAYFNSVPTPLTKGVKFETCLKVVNKDGEVLRGDTFLELKNVSVATIYLVSNSSFYFDDFKKQNKTDLEGLLKDGYGHIKNVHISDYQNLFKRLELKLGDKEYSGIPTNQRIQNVKEGNTDLGLEALLFQYGRYLLISSSRKGSMPANLQGLWNPYINAPWNADYHLNINLQMNYWLADVTNLGELNYPLFGFIDKLVENGKTTASETFGCRGSFVPHATDIWAQTWLRAPTAFWGCSLGAGGWLAHHYWEHFEYTCDTVFLRQRAFPAMHEITQFYSDWLISDPRDGLLVSAPSTSPENQFVNPEENKAAASCLGSAVDQQIIHELFTNYIRACHVLNISNPLLTKVEQQLPLLRPGFVIGGDGRILEWDREYQETEPGHRHISHIYGFHPGTSITKSKQPEIFRAIKTTLGYRLKNGGAGTGWSRGWLINCSARLLDGEMAHENIGMFLQKSLYDNLFDAHPPFQVDGNFGFTSGIAEMLIQSHEEMGIRILPALPDVWDKGFVKGIKARGGLTFDIYWENNKLIKLTVISDFDTSINLVYAEQIIPLQLKKGEISDLKFVGL